MGKHYFVTGIGTGIGKTLISAVLTEKLQADYWKPVQSGDLDNSDTLKVKALISNRVSVFHEETYQLTHPFSPHKSAKLDGIEIDLARFIVPSTSNTLVIEGAGGLMVPLNDRFLIIDLIKQLDAEVILVSQNYLGSINHTLLSAHVLKQYNIPVAGIIFNGDEDVASQDYILQYTSMSLLGRLPQLEMLNKTTIKEAGKYLTL